MSVWNVDVYSKFLDLRTRPARDLLAAIPETFQPKVVYDLGCGPANSTVLLKNRWPDAKVVGVDSSAAMLKKAQSAYHNIEFIQDDINQFAPPEKIDCLFANASLQWCEAHEKLIPKLIQTINLGGFFAIQMPNNFHSISHQASIHVLQTRSEWQPLLQKLIYGLMDKPRYSLPLYYDLFIASGLKEIQFWETEYYQAMESYRGIFDWVSGTALRPVIAEMDAASQQQFADLYIEEVAKVYPLQANGSVLLPFRRVFMVAIR